jgi:hypothetical protein
LVGPYTPGFVADASLADQLAEIGVILAVGWLVVPLKDVGADSVYSGEGEVALAFIEEILDSLGATPEQIDRERERAHRELFAEA